MNRFHTIGWVGVLALAGGWASGAAAQWPDGAGRPAPTDGYHDSRILVQFTPDATDVMRAEIRGLFGGETLMTYQLVPDLELISTDLPVEDTIRLLADVRGVEFAEPDYVARMAVIPNDGNFSWQWGLHNTGQSGNGFGPGIVDADIDAPEAWDIHTGDGDFVIASVDTGVEWFHIELDNNIWSNTDEVAGNGIDDDGNGFVDDIRGWDFHNFDNDPRDDNGHGTHTSGTIGAEGNNGIGVTGVMWDVQIMPIKALNFQGSGFISNLVAAVDYAVNNGAKVSNHSWAINGWSQTLANSVWAARGRGHLVVAAAGNNGTNNDQFPFYPASFDFDNVISVTSTNNRDQRFGNYGPVSVDMGAPGEVVWSTWPGNRIAGLSGTSMASPHVAGVAGLVWSHNPNWTYQEVRQRLLDTVRPVASMSGVTATGGVVNAFAALQDQAQVAELTDYELLDGVHISGGLPRLVESDDRTLETEARVTGEAHQPHLLRILFGAESGVQSASDMEIIFESRITDVEAIVELLLHNWNNGNWVRISQFNVGMDDLVHTRDVTNAGRFVRASDGRIEFEVKKIVVTPFTLGGFHSHIDQLQFTVE